MLMAPSCSKVGGLAGARAPLGEAFFLKFFESFVCSAGIHSRVLYPETENLLSLARAGRIKPLNFAFPPQEYVVTHSEVKNEKTKNSDGI